jgi:hypothetical protein
MPVEKLVENLNNEDLIGSRCKSPRLVGYIDQEQLGIGSRHKTPRPVGYIDHNIGSVLIAKHQGRSDTSITNNQRMINQQVSLGNRFWGKKKKKKRPKTHQRLAGTLTELQNKPETSITCR